MTIPEAIEAMRRNVGAPNEAGAMLVLADVWEEHEANVKCDACDGGHVKMRTNTGVIYGSCTDCHGTGYVSNGNTMRAEALRLLAECGKVGSEDGTGYYDADDGDSCRFGAGYVPAEWWEYEGEYEVTNVYCPIDNRLMLMDDYAAADQPTRERWARETRALVPGVDFEPPPVLSEDARSFLSAIQHIAEATR
jgi:hypothetical protein